ncbi:MAG: EMC3/TMCO1 family protein [Candidatus Bathyarchaeia archaeon]
MEWLLAPQAPGATIFILLICIAISCANSSINRLLINRLIGWEEYQKMQKELAEYRSLSSKAMRSKDQKLLKKVEKQRSRISNIQKQMSKPQTILFVISFSYIIIWWLFLIPFYGSNPVAFIPGLGGVPVVWWYFPCSLFFGTVFSRILGVAMGATG